MCNAMKTCSFWLNWLTFTERKRSRNFKLFHKYILMKYFNFSEDVFDIVLVKKGQNAFCSYTKVHVM